MFKASSKSTACLAQSSCELPEQPATHMKTQPQPAGCTCPARALPGRCPSHLQLTTLCWLRACRAQCACARLAPCRGHSSPSPLASQLGRGQQVSSGTARLQCWGTAGVKTHHLCFSLGWGREVNPICPGKADQPEAAGQCLVGRKCQAGQTPAAGWRENTWSKSSTYSTSLKNLLASACTWPCLCVPEGECATEGKTALVILGEGTHSLLTYQVWVGESRCEDTVVWTDQQEKETRHCGLTGSKRNLESKKKSKAERHSPKQGDGTENLNRL